MVGASSGIGRATALAFASQRAHVVLAARRIDALQEVAVECARLGARVLVQRCDVADVRDVELLADTAVSRFGTIDVWVNVAGVLLFGSLEETPLHVYERVIDVNLMGQVRGAKAALRVFRTQGHGTLVNVGSLAGRMAAAHANAYTASKHAVAGMSEALREELVGRPSIDVCWVTPAGIDTPIVQHAGNHTGIRVRPLYPLRIAEDVADAVVELALRPRKREIVVGKSGKAQAFFSRHAPHTHEKLVGVSTALARRRADPHPIDDGNLFEPVDEGWSTDGGHKEGRGRRKSIIWGLAVGAALWTLRDR